MVMNTGIMAINESDITSTLLPKLPQVLLVEDDPLVRKVHRFMLEKFGCYVDLAKNAEEALHYAPKGYDLILLDIGLPDKSGIEVMEFLRQRELGWQRTPIIVLTGYCHQEIEGLCQVAGADEVFIKPIRLEHLFEILHRYLH